mgnify:CR=1 FL=1
MLTHKEQIILHLPSEFDGRHLSAMPATEGNIVIVDVPVATLNLAQESTFRTFGGAKDGIRPDIVGQHLEK